MSGFEVKRVLCFDVTYVCMCVMDMGWDGRFIMLPRVGGE